MYQDPVDYKTGDWQFLQEEIKIINEHLEKYSSCLVTRHENYCQL